MNIVAEHDSEDGRRHFSNVVIRPVKKLFFISGGRPNFKSEEGNKKYC